MLGSPSRLFYLGPDGHLFENIIKGNIQQDLNSDCVVQPGETPLSGWTVWAYGPINNYGVTDSLGNFEILVDTGTYEVRAPTPGFVWQPCTPAITTDFPSLPDTNDLGTFLMESVPVTMNTISGIVFHDLNGNCIQDPGEPGLANCTLWAVAEQQFPTGSPYTATTDADGFYSFTLPAGFEYFIELAGLENNPSCTSCTSGFWQSLNAVPVTQDIDLQCQGSPPQHLSGLVFYDLYDNCFFDIGGEDGVAGWSMKVVKQGSTDTLRFDGSQFPNGEFSVSVDTGVYDLFISEIDYPFYPCEPQQTIQVSTSGAPLLYGFRFNRLRMGHYQPSLVMCIRI